MKRLRSALRAFRYEFALRPVSSSGLALFRMAWSTVLAFEVLQIAFYRHLIFDPVPYVEPASADMLPVLIAWLVALACLFAGFRTRLSAAVNYVLSVLVLNSVGDHHYHMFFVYIGVNLLLVALPIHQQLSVDAWRRRRQGRPLPRRTAALSYHALLVVGIALVYFDSVLHKLAAPMWTRGLGLWLPASLPPITWLDVSPILDIRSIALGLGFLTLGFEALYPFVFWWNRAKPVLLCVGLGLHIGILVVFPIPWFGIGMCALYLAALPFAWYDRMDGALREPQTADPAPDAPATRRAPGQRPAFAVLVVVVVAQSLSMLRAPAIGRIAADTPLAPAVARLRTATQWAQEPTRALLGTVPHTVFMDYHFAGYDRVFALRTMAPNGGRWLPIIRETGQVHPLLSGGQFVFWTFRAHGPMTDSWSSERFLSGVKRMTAFWARHGYGTPAGSRFELLVRRQVPRFSWTKGQYRNTRTYEWHTVGTVAWRNGVFFHDLPILESTSP